MLDEIVRRRMEILDDGGVTENGLLVTAIDAFRWDYPFCFVIHTNTVIVGEWDK